MYMLTQSISYLCTTCIILNLYYTYTHTMSCYMNIWIICIHDLCNAYTQNNYLYLSLPIPLSLSLSISRSLSFSLSLSLDVSIFLYVYMHLSIFLSLSLPVWMQSI